MAFGRPEYVLSTKCRKLIRYHSRYHPGRSHLFMRCSLPKRIATELKSYWRCLKCRQLKQKHGFAGREARLQLLHDADSEVILTDPEAGHHRLCAPYGDSGVEMREILQRTKMDLKRGHGRPRQAYAAMRERVARLPESIQCDAETEIPPYEKIRRTLYRSCEKNIKVEVQEESCSIADVDSSSRNEDSANSHVASYHSLTEESQQSPAENSPTPNRLVQTPSLATPQGLVNSPIPNEGSQMPVPYSHAASEQNQTVGQVGQHSRASSHTSSPHGYMSGQNPALNLLTTMATNYDPGAQTKRLLQQPQSEDRTGKRFRPSSTSAPEDRFELVGRLVAMKLRALPPDKSLMMEKLINDSFFDAEMGNLQIRTVQQPYMVQYSQQQPRCPLRSAYPQSGGPGPMYYPGQHPAHNNVRLPPGH